MAYNYVEFVQDGGGGLSLANNYYNIFMKDYLEDPV